LCFGVRPIGLKLKIEVQKEKLEVKYSIQNAEHRIMKLPSVCRRSAEGGWRMAKGKIKNEKDNGCQGFSAKGGTA
jgi:hypothetical protein